MLNKLLQKLFSRLTSFQENPFHPFVWIAGNPDIGKNVYIGGFSIINAQNVTISIGDNCDIASFVSINSADSHKRCFIGNNVFVGSHSVIKGGAQIGAHSVIAAGTIVDPEVIPPYSLVSGNPMTVKQGYFKK